MIRSLLAALVGAILFAALPASAHFIDGYLAQCTSVGAGTCTEIVAGGYARQPIFFNSGSRGVVPIGSPWDFPNAGGTIAGRAVYDAATGGNLLLVLPLATPIVLYAGSDQGFEAAVVMTVPAMQPYAVGDMFTGAFAAGATVGTTSDGSTITAGSPLTVARGLLYAAAPLSDNAYRQAAQVTGFSYQTPAGVSTVNITAAGTLAAGTVILPQAPVDGTAFTLLCDQTITALTLTLGTGTTLIGTSPATCGPTVPRQLRFLKANNTWHVVQ